LQPSAFTVTVTATNYISQARGLGLTANQTLNVVRRAQSFRQRAIRAGSATNFLMGEERVSGVPVSPPVFLPVPTINTAT
jgi:hypothetical protein